MKILLHAIPGAALDKALVKEFGLTTIEATRTSNAILVVDVGVGQNAKEGAGC